MNWHEVCLHDNPNKMQKVWKNKFLNVIDKHTPLRKKRIGKKESPWITADVLSKIHKTDYLLQKAKLMMKRHGDHSELQELRQTIRSNRLNAIMLKPTLSNQNMIQGKPGNL